MKLKFSIPEALVRWVAPNLFQRAGVTGRASRGGSWLKGIISASVEIERPILIDREGVAYPPARRVVLRGKDAR